MNENRPIDIIVPFYRNSQLVQTLFASVDRCRTELDALGCRIIAINDSPDDEDLARELDHVLNLPNRLATTLIANEANLGFVKSANRGLAAAQTASHDAVLMNSDAILFPGSMAEIAAVAQLDPMIGFVSPRSNNATICSLPHAPEFSAIPPAGAYTLYQSLGARLPRYQYAPTAVGFCLFIKWEILREFGLLDEAYAQGYNEENDLISRANRCGFRAALANRAYVYHIGEASFATSPASMSVHEPRNRALLDSRYPEYGAAVQRYLQSPQYEAEQMLSALVPSDDGTLDVVFDLLNLGTYHCGTFELAKQLLIRAVENWRGCFRVHALVSEEAKRFHELGNVAGLRFVPPESQHVFAAAVHVGQPFNPDVLVRMSRRAVVNAYVMLDAIAYDCAYLCTADLAELWGFVMARADAVCYISNFVRDQFNRRFATRAGLEQVVTYLSLDPTEYGSPEASDALGEYLLIIGNKFEHKRMRPTLEALSNAFPSERIVAIGIEGRFAPNVECQPSGYLSEEAIDDFYRRCSVAIYPSLNEGFGIPVVKALAYRRPVLARSIPVIQEIRARLADRDNVHLFESTADLIDFISRGVPPWKSAVPRPNDPPPYRWETAVCDMGKCLSRAISTHNLPEILVPRLEAVRRLTTSCRADQGSQNTFELYERLDRAEREIAEVRASLSWRITAPLRRIAAPLIERVRGRA